MEARPRGRPVSIVAVAVLGTVPAVVGAAVTSPVGPGRPGLSDTDTIVQVWGSTVTATAGGRATVAIRIDMSASGDALGRIRGRARFTPTLLNFEGVAHGSADGELDVDTTRVEAGVLGFELDAGESPGSAGPATLAEITFWVTAAPGGLASVVLELDALEAAGSGADLLGRTVVREGTVLVR